MRWLALLICASVPACGDDSVPGGSGGAGGAGGMGGMAGTDGGGGMAGTDGGGGLDGAVLYVTGDDGSLYAFSVGTWAQLSHTTGLPLTDGVRGIDADPQNGVLFIAHGGDDLGSSGHLLAWNLAQNRMVYDATYNHGIDQLAYGGGKIYMPAGELANTTTWYVLDATTGMQVGTEVGGSYPHNTIDKNGHRYYGGRQDNYLRILGVGAGMVGPSPSSQIGVRPFTVNATETRVWITWTHYRGFSVGDVTTGAILTSVNFGAVPASYTPTAASHGISLAPDGSEIYVLDTPNNQVRVYDATDAPALRATVSLTHPIFPGNESPCAYDCLRDGWLLHSGDGAYVYVGDSGDVIDTRSRQIVHQIAPLAQSRHGFIEIEWSHGAVVDTTTHFGVGR